MKLYRPKQQLDSPRTMNRQFMRNDIYETSFGTPEREEREIQERIDML